MIFHARVFKEVLRVLKPGGRLIISDIVLLKELPDFIKDSVEAYIGCLSGAIMRDEYIEAIKVAGFQEVKIIDETSFPIECMANDLTAKAIIRNLKMSTKNLNEIANSVVSIKVYGVKPNSKILESLDTQGFPQKQMMGAARLNLSSM